MAWTRPTLQQIIDRIDRDMESRLTGNVALLRRAVLRVLSRVFAGSIHIGYGYIEEMAKMIMVDSADAEFLNRHAYIWGVNRKPASFSSGSVAFTGTSGSAIPAGTEVRTLTGSEYATLAAGTILDGVAKIPVQSKVAGSDGNISVPTTLSVISPIPSVDTDCFAGLMTVVYSGLAGGTFAVGTTVLNSTRSGEAVVVEDNGSTTMIAALKSGEFQTGDAFSSGAVSASVNGAPTIDEAITGGQEAESDDDLRARILQRIQLPPAGGSAADYVRWALEVVAVDAAWSIPESPAPGYVTVVIKARGTDPVPSADLIAEVLAHINKKRPVTANVVVVGVLTVEVNFDIHLVDTESSDQLKATIRSNMEALFGSEMTHGGLMPISQIRGAISASGASDYLISTLTTSPALTPPANPNSNLQLTGYQYGIVNTMTFGVLQCIMLT